MSDLNTFGFMFEALVERDLKIYANYLDGHLYHFRDNVKFAIEEAKKTLLSFFNNMRKKPKFMCIITSNTTYVAKDKETGIYILPITALKP